MIVDIDVDLGDFSAKELLEELEYRVSHGKLPVEEITLFLEKVAKRHVYLIKKDLSFFDKQKIDFVMNNYQDMDMQGVEYLFS